MDAWAFLNLLLSSVHFFYFPSAGFSGGAFSPAGDGSPTGGALLSGAGAPAAGGVAGCSFFWQPVRLIALVMINAKSTINPFFISFSPPFTIAYIQKN